MNPTSKIIEIRKGRNLATFRPADIAELSDGVLFLRGLVGSSDGSTLIRGDISGHVEQAEELGQVLADDLLSRGAAAILAELHATAD